MTYWSLSNLSFPNGDPQTFVCIGRAVIIDGKTKVIEKTYYHWYEFISLIIPNRIQEQEINKTENVREELIKIVARWISIGQSVNEVISMLIRRVATMPNFKYVQ